MSKFNNLRALAAKYAEKSAAQSIVVPTTQESVEKQAADNKSLAVKFLQCLPAQLKLIHVATKSYAKHMALDSAFETLNDTLDTFYECVQGHYVLKTGSRIALSDKAYSFDTPEDSEVLETVGKMHKAFLSAADAVTDSDTSLESVRDDVTNAFQQLAYRLTLK